MSASGLVGLELELLAPRGKGRRALAEAVARSAGGRVQFGLKYTSPGPLADGRPRCELGCAYRVARAGKALGTLVDDPSLALPRGGTDRRESWAGETDDVRLALLAESVCWASAGDARQVYAPLAQLFDGAVERAPAGGFAVVDAVGHPLVRGGAGGGGRARACEVVLPPLAPAELRAAVERWLAPTRRLGFSIPREGALHAHFDAAPFRKTPRLRRLILAWAKERDAWWRALAPNPGCVRLGPPPPKVVRVAKEADDALPFPTFAAALLLAGAHKACDLNLLGVLEQRPRHPTLEVRCLPMSLDAALVERKVRQAAGLLGLPGLFGPEGAR